MTIFHPDMNRRRILSLLLPPAGLGALGLGGLAACQARLIYFPRPYQPGMIDRFTAAGGRALAWRTPAGGQQGWLLPQRSGASPERLWLVCAGNASLSLDLLDAAAPWFPQDAFLFFDYPGYGGNAGRPHPHTIRESLAAAWLAAAQAVALDAAAAQARGRFLGHSLGAAVALIGAELHGLHRGVLVSPFTSTMAMADAMLPIPAGWLVTHRFDNRRALAGVGAAPDAAIVIVHGSQDEVIPVAMGRELATIAAPRTRLVEVPAAHHNDIFDAAPDKVRDAMLAAR